MSLTIDQIVGKGYAQLLVLEVLHKCPMEIKYVTDRILNFLLALF